MRLPSFVLLFTTLASPFFVACGPSESDTGYQVRGDEVYYVYRATPASMNGLGGLVNERREHLVAGADGKTFVVLPVDGYAKDARHVFRAGRVLPGSHAPTFQLMAGGTWAKDAGQVYDDGWVIAGADPATYQRLGRGLVGRDKKDYYFGAVALHVRDVNAFTVINPNADSQSTSDIWGYDKQSFYVREEATPADGETFKVLGYRYAKDATHVYYQRGRLAEADAKTFQSAGGEFGKDARQAYWNDFVLAGSDPRTFRVLEYNYATDARQAYHLNEVIAGAEASTFRVIGPSTKGFGYGKDARRVYYAASVIDGADPATFTVDTNDPERASDKNGRYQYGRPVAK